MPLPAPLRPPGASRPDQMRARNERIAAAARHNRFDESLAVPFLCECNDSRCECLLRLTLVEYGSAREVADHIAAPGHQVDAAKIVRVRDGCWLYRRVPTAVVP
jgi:hypothetical protein